MTPASPIEPSDFDALLELLDRATMREVVTMFSTSAPERVTAVRRGIASDDGHAVRISVQVDHPFRSKLITGFAGC